MYTIGQVAKLFHLPISTIRYYDKEGLFPTLERTSGIRKFSETELETLRMIECLKKSGLEIKEIKQFMEWCSQGSSTYEKRHELFLHQQEIVEQKIEKLEKVLDMIRFKCWYYEQAIQDGNEERLKELIPDALPEKIKKLYERAHEE
nr:MerR family transcriptional regulator [uncultured Faecalimonas sp.]